MQKRQNFIYRNESFTCQQCGQQNGIPPNGKIRNHCWSCLYSLHLDADIPGDRASDCLSLMQPVQAYQSQKGWMVRHECLKCKKQIPNLILDDDNWDQVVELSKPWA